MNHPKKSLVLRVRQWVKKLLIPLFYKIIYRYVVPSTVEVVVEDADGLFLLCEEVNGPDAYLLGLPGGKQDPGESEIVAGLRELRQETLIEVDEDDLSRLPILEDVREDLSRHNGGKPAHVKIALFHHLYKGSKESLIGQDGRKESLRWVTLAEAEMLNRQGKLRGEYVLRALENAAARRFLPWDIVQYVVTPAARMILAA